MGTRRNLEENLPLPLAAVWQELTHAAEVDPAALASARRTVRLLLEGVGAAAKRDAAGHSGDPLLAEVERLLSRPLGGGKTVQEFLLGGVPADPAREFRLLEDTLAAIADSPLHLLAVIGKWTVHLVGPDTGDAIVRAEVFAACGDRRASLHPAWIYDPDEDRMQPGAEDAPPAPSSGNGAPLDGEIGSIGRIGPYRLLRQVSRGGQGVLYEAMQDHPPRRVALKTLPAAIGIDERSRRRMIDEGAALARIEHPGVVPVYACGESDGTPWIAMRFVEGESLEAVLDRRRRDGRPMPWREAAHIARDLARALDVCHERGVIHRDVKPANILVDSAGRVQLADFGLAAFRAGGTMTAGEAMVGTLHYLAPELLDGAGRRPDPRVDVYGLGATLYELLRLKRPFEDRAGGSEALLKAISTGEPAPLRRAGVRLPKDLQTIVATAMARDPARRYATALDLAEDLERLLAGLPIRARRPGPLERTVRWARRRPAAAIAAGAFVAIAVLTGALFVRQRIAELEGIRTERAEAARRRAETAGEVLDRAWRAHHTAYSRSRAEWVTDLVRISSPEAVEVVASRLDACRDLPRGDSRLHLLTVCLEALGRMGHPEIAGPAVGRYLAVEDGEEQALLAGAALRRMHLRGADVSAYAAPGIARFGPESRFFAEVGMYLPAGAGEAALPVPIELAESDRRPHHGGIRFAEYELLGPSYVESRYFLGMPQDGRADRNEEVDRTTRLLRREPNDVAVREERLDARKRLNHLESAFHDATVLIELGDYGSVPRTARAHLRRMMGDLQGALRDVDRALEQTPEWDEPHRCRALILVDLGRTDEAVAAATRAIELAPSPAARSGGLSYRAMAHLAAGRPAEARADAAEALRLDPSGIEPANTLAMAHLMLGDVDQALEPTARVVKADPQYTLGWHGRGTALLLAGDSAGARAAFTRALDTDAHLPFSWLNRGIQNAVEGRIEEAREDLRAAVVRCPELAHSWLAYGRFEAANGRPEEARVALGHVPRLAGDDDPLAREARELLAALPR